MKHYKVLLLDGHKAQPDQIVDGYLGNIFGDGKIITYTRGEAIKKARMFGGKIVLHKTLVYDKVNARVVTEDDNQNAFYTDTFNTESDFCDDTVVEKVIEMFNTGNDLMVIDDYLLNEEKCTQESREIIIEGLFLIYNNL